jgi:hypothetical protein
LKRKILLSIAGVLLLSIILLAYVGLTAGRDLLAARAVLTGSAADLDRQSIDEALGRLESASDGLNSIPARVLGLVPVVRQNLSAARAITDAAIPVLQEAQGVSDELDRLEETGVIVDGRIQLDEIAQLQEPLDQEAEALSSLGEEAEDQLSGWLLPPVWDALDELASRTTELGEDAAHAGSFTEHARAMLGDPTPRRYLVIFMNNAELRGSGGVPSGIGTLGVRRGELKLGRFFYEETLADEAPFRRVPAPSDFRRRFHEHASDTTLWVNTTFSPDTPEVAVVASRLYKLVTGIETDGALFVDPRGMAALLGPDGEVTIPQTNRTISAQEFPEYTYSTAYDDLGPGDRRRQALLDAGKAAFNAVIAQGFGGRDSLSPIAAALSGRHLMFVSFDPEEESLLEGVRASGSLATDALDAVDVTVQNFAADKLDYWMDRDIDHECLVEEAVARCRTVVRLTNRTPDGLGELVAPDPYGVTKSYTEIYVPEDAHLLAVKRDGAAASYFLSGEDGLTSYGDLIKVPAGGSSTFEVLYELDVPAGGYSFSATPQPLSHDATLEVRLDVPPGWTVAVDGETVDGQRVFEGELNKTVVITTAPNRRSGLPAFWDALQRFWNDPLF